MLAGDERAAALRSAVQFLEENYQSLSLVLLIGSAALGRPSIASDLDFAAIVDTQPDIDDASLRMRFEGTDVDVHFYESRWLEAAGARTVFDLRELREIGRIASGRVLWGDRRIHSRFLASAKKAALAPLDLIVLSSRASAAGLPNTSEPGDRWWRDLSSALALAVLAISLLPVRFQKPKWLHTDLKQQFPQIASILLRLVAGDRPALGSEGAHAQAMLDGVEELCGQLGYSGMARVDGSPIAYRRVRECWRDANALIDAALYEDAHVAASMALLETRALIAEKQHSSLAQQTLYNRWFAAIASNQLALSQLTTQELDAISDDLRKHHLEIERIHWQRLEVALPKKRKGSAPNKSHLHRSALLNLTQVSDSVWFGGSVSDPMTLELVKAAGVSTLVLVAEEEQEIPSELTDVQVKFLPIRDANLSRIELQAIDSKVNDLSEELSKVAGSVFICCSYGINRSALVAALLLSRREQVSKAVAADAVRQSRRDALRNSTFWKYLQSED